MIPPARSQSKPARGNAWKIGTNASTHSHPIPIYNTEDNHFGQVIQHPFSIILFHELGHFLFAKLNKIVVTEFSLGMGPRLLSTEKNGQGISAAVGMALSAKLSNESYRVYTLLGDGEIQEGQVWEAAMFAGHRKLDNLVVIVDNNGLQIDGKIDDVCSPYPIDKKFEAFNFHVINVADGNDMDQLKAAFDEAKATKGMPTAIIMKTVKGKGVSFMENQAGWHGKAPNDEQYAQAMADLEKVGEALCQK